MAVLCNIIGLRKGKGGGVEAQLFSFQATDLVKNAFNFIPLIRLPWRHLNILVNFGRLFLFCFDRIRRTCMRVPWYLSYKRLSADMLEGMHKASMLRTYAWMMSRDNSFIGSAANSMAFVWCNTKTRLNGTARRTGECSKSSHVSNDVETMLLKVKTTEVPSLLSRLHRKESLLHKNKSKGFFFCTR